MGGTLLLIVVLVVLAMVLVIVEICTPTMGLVTAMVLGCLGWAIYLAWGVGSLFGLLLLIATLVLMPLYIFAAVKLLPKTALGRRIYLSRDLAPPGEGTPEAASLARFVGREAVAECALRPSGTIRIDGQRLIAQAERGLIEKGQTVLIIQAAGNRLVVRKVENQ